jgi:hypothetical protein
MKILENNKPGTLSMFIAILQVIFIVSGCSAVQQTYGISETDLSWIKLGMKRSEIEAKLELGIVMEAKDKLKCFMNLVGPITVISSLFVKGS